MAATYFRAVRDFPHFGIWAGDSVKYDPTSPLTLTVVRHLPPNHGALLLAIEEGALMPVSGDLSAFSLPTPAPLPPPGHVVPEKRWLRRVK